MTPTGGGRAYATVHGVRWNGVVGKNIGCPLGPSSMGNYSIQLMQNSSLGSPMIHTSQNDTMVADLGYLTNMGKLYSITGIDGLIYPL